MAVKKGTTIKDAFDELKGEFRAWSDSATAALTTLSGADVGIDVLKSLWHEARETIAHATALRARVETLGASPAEGRQNLRDYAEAMYGSTYDILTEAQTFLGLLGALQTAIVTSVGGVDAQGFIVGQYMKLSDVEPFLRQVTAVEYAGVVTAVQAISAAIED